MVRTSSHLISSVLCFSETIDWLLTNDVFVFCFDEWRHSWRLRSLGLTSRGIKSSLREEEVTASFVRTIFQLLVFFFIICWHFFLFNIQRERLITEPGFVWLIRTKTSTTLQNFVSSSDSYVLLTLSFYYYYVLLVNYYSHDLMFSLPSIIINVIPQL
jgi:hypothetical protein